MASIVASVVLLDQWSKWLVVQALGPQQSYEVIRNFFHLVHVRNPGAAFGLLAAFDARLVVPFFTATSFLAIGVIGILFFRLSPRAHALQVALSLILAGAIGNLIDRLVRQEVVDFLDWHWYGYHWPAFNLADAGITVGVGLILLHLFRERKGEEKKQRPIT